jgi:hypothetical protein
MSNQRMRVEKLYKLFHHLDCCRRITEHSVGNSCNCFNLTRHKEARIDQTLKSVNNFLATQQDSTYFNCTVSFVGVKSSSFKVEDDNGFALVEQLR